MKATIHAPLALLLSTGAASAADLPARKAPEFVPPPPVFLYEGFYVGAQAGAAGFADRAETLLAPNNARLWHRTARGGSFIGGVHAGYDWRYGPLVFGLVGEVSGARARANIVDPFFNSSVKSGVDAQGSFRGRVGYAYDRALFYVTGGLSAAHFEHDYKAPLGAQNYNYLWVTPTLGAGVEYALTPQWSANVEYRIFGGRTKVEAANFAGPALAARQSQGEGQVTAGVSYHFGK